MVWYVLRTKCHHEKVVEAATLNRRIDCFLPKVRETRQWKDRKREIDSPVFPGYVFVRPHPEQFDLLRYLPGSCGLVKFRNSPGVIANDVVESIRIVMQRRLPFVNNQEIQNGDTVVVCSGPLKDVVGELVRIKGGTRLVINAFILGKSLSLEIDSSDVRKISSAEAPKTVGKSHENLKKLCI